MATLKERLPGLREEFLLRLKEKKKKFGEDDPREWYSYMSDHRFLAVCSYVLDHNVQGFLDHMKQVVHYQLKEFNKKMTDPAWAYWNYPCYQSILNALNSHDPLSVVEITKYTLNVNLKSQIHVLAKYLHKAFRLFILGQDGTRQDLDDMETIFAKRLKSYVGYAICFQAIYDHDKEKFLSGFDTMIKGHKRLSTPQGIFGGYEDEVIAFWPLAVVNLARLKGLDVMVDYPLVPKDLVIKQLGGL